MRLKLYIKKKLMFAFLCVVGVCYSFPLMAEETIQKNKLVIARIVIKVSGRADTQKQLEDTARALITIREGELLSGEKLQTSIDLLKGSGMFQTIHVPDPFWKESGITLQFQLTPFTRIKDIKIKGGFPLLERKILNAMELYTGDVFESEKLKPQEKRIEKLFIDDGYIAPQVIITSEQDPSDGNHIVNVSIDKGDFYVIKHMEIAGNKSFSDVRLQLRADAWKTIIPWYEIRKFVRKTFERNVKDLIEFYRRKGYADVVIQLKVEHVPGRRDVFVRVDIEEGALYKIKFEGNTHFWDYTLKKDLVLESRGNLNDLGLKRSIRSIRERYRKAGYADARVSMKEEIQKNKERTVRKIRLLVDEGGRSIVSSVSISGNKAFSHRQIKKQVITSDSGIFTDGEFDLKVLEEDKHAIQALYHKNGYLNVSVDDRIEWKEGVDKKNIRWGDIFISINEGTQTRVHEIVFNGLSVLNKNKISDYLALKPGKSFSNEKFKQDENTISAMISEMGYTHGSVTGSVQHGNNGDIATVIFEVDEGPLVAMGEVFCTGNFRTKKKIITNEVDLAPGEPFSLVKILENQRNIRNISALDSANFKLLGLNEKAENVHLLVEAEEKKPFYFQLGAGYDTKKKMHANTRVGDRNLFGLNKDVWANVEYSLIGHSEEVSLTEPRFLGTRISSTLNMYAEELEEFNKDYGTITYGVSLVFNRKFWKRFRASLSFRYEKRHTYQTEPESITVDDEDQYEKRNMLTTTPSIIYDSTDSYVSPTKGIYASFSIDLSTGIDYDFDDFLRHRVELRYFYTPVNRLTFAVRGKYGYIEPGESNDLISKDQLFFLGGTSDVRGFDENMLRYDQDGDSVGGRSSVLGSLEARYNAWDNLEITTFYDIGSIRYVYDDDDNDGFQASVGTGLRYITPIGPIGFLYGWKVDPREGESSGKLHFTIGHTF